MSERQHITEFLGPISEEELGFKILEFVEKLDLIDSIGLTPEQKRVVYLLKGSYSGYHEIPAGTYCDRYEIDENNWISVIKFYDMTTDSMIYRLTTFRDM